MGKLLILKLLMSPERNTVTEDTTADTVVDMEDTVVDMVDTMADTADTDPTVTDAPLPTTSRDKNIVTKVIVVVMAVILDMVDTPAMVMVMVDTVVTTKSINPNLKSIRSTLFFCW